MLKKDAAIHRLRDHSAHLAEEFGVDRIGLFGSVVSGLADESSDVDIVVELRRPLGFKFIELVEYLEDLLGRKVDVLTPAGLRDIRVPGVASHIAETVVYV